MASKNFYHLMADAGAQLSDLLPSAKQAAVRALCVGVCVAALSSPALAQSNPEGPIEAGPAAVQSVDADGLAKITGGLSSIASGLSDGFSFLTKKAESAVKAVADEAGSAVKSVKNQVESSFTGEPSQAELDTLQNAQRDVLAKRAQVKVSEKAVAGVVDQMHMKGGSPEMKFKLKSLQHSFRQFNLAKQEGYVQSLEKFVDLATAMNEKYGIEKLDARVPGYADTLRVLSSPASGNDQSLRELAAKAESAAVLKNDYRGPSVTEPKTSSAFKFGG